MSKTFITDLHIEKVRHIENFDIPLSKSEMKHLIITGKNGSGKTSVLIALRDALNYSIEETGIPEIHRVILRIENSQFLKQEFFDKGKYVMAYYPARRLATLHAPSGVEKINFKNAYHFEDKPGNDFIQFMVNMFFDSLLAHRNNDEKNMQKIDRWFSEIQKSILLLMDQPDAKFEFDEKNYNYNIVEKGKEPYNLNQLSDGYSAIFSIVTDIIMRMEKVRVRSYDTQGVVLIDEIETHLHVDLQKKILPFLTAFFPNIQFIVTTHSPFVISSIKNAVICDLEKRIVTEDLSGYSYGTLVESYFGNDNYSDQLKSDLNEYESLMKAEKLTLDEEERLQDLEVKLNQLPKYWAPELDFKLKQIQLEKADRATA